MYGKSVIIISLTSMSRLLSFAFSSHWCYYCRCCYCCCCCCCSITKGVKRSNTLIAYQIVINEWDAASLMINHAPNMYSARSNAMMILLFEKKTIWYELNKNGFEWKGKIRWIAPLSLMAHCNNSCKVHHTQQHCC